MNRTFEWGVIATFLSVLSIVHRRSARLTYFLHPKLRKITAVLITPRLITRTLQHLRHTGSIPIGSTHLLGHLRVWVWMQAGPGSGRRVAADSHGELAGHPVWPAVGAVAMGA